MEKRNLKSKIKDKSCQVGIVGLGYAGLPLSIAFCKAGFKVTGIDTDKSRVNKLKEGNSYIEDVESKDLKELVKENRFKVSSDYKDIKKVDVVIISVPTPLGKTKEPDISYILSSVKSIARHTKGRKLIVLESTTYPGTTKEEILPLLEKSGLKLDKDFYLAFSPERVDPGNKNFDLTQIPKIIGAVSRESKTLAESLYSQVFDKVICVSSTEVAETTKLLENTFRNVNIALINEIALMCNKLDIDVWEVIEAAKTKPFGFMPFYPGPGLGGHCLPTDPIYLSWKAKLAGFETRLVGIAQQINNLMPEYIISRISIALNRKKKSINSSDILIIGVSYKKDVGDTRESPALSILSLLKNKKANISYYDPHVKEVKIDGKKYKSTKLNKNSLKNRDCVVIISDHSDIDYKLIAKNSKLIFDTRNALKDIDNIKAEVIKL
jgi:UDP-N-acetyl-D-glucosamine dehydrogenase